MVHLFTSNGKGGIGKEKHEGSQFVDQCMDGVQTRNPPDVPLVTCRWRRGVTILKSLMWLAGTGSSQQGRSKASLVVLPCPHDHIWNVVVVGGVIDVTVSIHVSGFVSSWKCGIVGPAFVMETW